MGVQNLWMLLAPVGRKIEIESLATQVLAVDASIWLTQFIKAMRDDEGNMIRNAHLIGTFHRVAKLLFYRVRPVFVFDGNTPEIKKRTVARRRRRQENQAANLRQTAQRILLNRLKLYREELKKSGGKPIATPAIDPNFCIPEASNATEEKKENGGSGSSDTSGAGATGQESVIVIDGDADEQVDGEKAGSVRDDASQTQRTANVDVVSASIRGQNNTEIRSDGSGDDMDTLTVDDIELDMSRLSKLDLEAVFALPVHLQKDMVMRIMRDRRQEVRDKFIPLAGNPEAYSRAQISSFLETTKLSRRLERARQKSVQVEIENASNGDDEDSLRVHSKRIASSSDRYFVYKKTDEKSDSDEEMNGISAMSSEEKAIELTHGNSEDRSRENDDDVFSRLHGNLRKHQKFDENNVAGKQRISEFSVGETTQFMSNLNRSEQRKLAVEEARRNLLEKQKHQPQEAPLAIESARLSRQSEQNAHSVKLTNDPVTAKKDGICITFKSDEAHAINEKIKEMFPDLKLIQHDASGLSVANLATQNELGDLRNDDNEGDEIEWETVAIPGKQETQKTIAIERSKEAVAADGEDGDSAVIGNKDDPNIDMDADPKSSPAEVVRIVDDEPDEPDDVEEDFEWEDVPAPKMMSHSESVDAASLTNSVVTSRSKYADPGFNDADEGDTNELFTSLKSELDEEQAELDLAALKEEALQSAIATASNLTQWAAGAVRRALAPHTRSSNTSVGIGAENATGSELIAKEAKFSDSPTKSLNSQLVDDTVSNETRGIEQTSENITAQVADDDQLLQQAIQQSIEETTGVPQKTTRYLQYTTDPEPVINVEAIEQEQVELIKLRNRQMRDVEGVNDEMVEEVMELLRLFGVPFLVCPMEAEAQCAALEQLGLVDGIITDDSDIFPFGGKKVYKNIFHNQKFVEAFLAHDIHRELGFTQDELISLAILLGSDYTDGVRGIGIVNATEVVNAYPGLEGLQEFKEWVNTFDVGEEAFQRQEKKKSQDDLDQMDIRSRFQHTHSNARRKWELSEEFPSRTVVQAYKNPQVDRSDARFSWSLPDLAGLRAYCTGTFGWDQSKTDTVLLPLMEQIANNAKQKHVQTRIDHYFTSYEDNVKYAKIRSKRLRSAVNEKTKSKDPSDDAQSTNSPTAQGAKERMGKGKFKRTKKTTSTLGFS